MLHAAQEQVLNAAKAQESSIKFSFKNKEYEVPKVLENRFILA